MNTINKNRLFVASCIALIVTAMTFAIRAGILSQLGSNFQLTDTELGWINSMAFLGFPIATIFGGLVYNSLGARKLMVIAFISHLLGLVLTILAGGFWTLLISTFFIGFANGSVEAACNPLIADMFTTNRTTMLNKFHVWFPGGIVLGALVSKFMTDLNMGWQYQIGIMLIPTLLYGLLFFGQTFPKNENMVSDTKVNIKSLLSPLFLFMVLCMTLTATTELGTQQWVEKILGNSGASPMLILAMVTGLMAVGRYFAGPVIHKLNPPGVLLMSAVISTLAIFLMSTATGSMVYVAAILFAVGVCYFWPTMIGFVSEYIPKTGALGMSLIGGAGMFATSIWQPVIGSWLDNAKATALESGLGLDQAELLAGQIALGNIAYFPMGLILLFGILFLNRKKLEKFRV
ncbi:MFS transporter [Aestuariibaculum sediminum]|uniref:MFS transporter n=1 Tax=Aestuariibaculum sediminum TaxID=2770637 RepID=A0A8J6QBG3_9FLAO|nr:MFS transporter [Aestuariibaculum sediminum]MBD0832941.1 MFS transporter [Aestuariibaculum sediminum]